MRARRLRFVVAAGLLVLVALRALRSRSSAPTSEPSRPVLGNESEHVPTAPPGVGAAPDRSPRIRWVGPNAKARPSLVPRFALVSLAALVPFIGVPTSSDPVRVALPGAVTSIPLAIAPSSGREVLSEPARSDPVELEAVTPRAQAEPRPVAAPVLRPAATMRTAALLRTHIAYSRPSHGSAPLGHVRGRRPLTGARTVLPVVKSWTDARGNGWLRVMLPGRPNGRTGWIRQRATISLTTSWHILVEPSERRVTIFRDGRRKRVVDAVVGKPSTPTPLGRFFVEEAIQLDAGAVGAPYALALSARSTVLQRFNGGPGQIALHGLANVGGVLGSAASHGCVRLDNDVMSWLVHRIGPGVPVTITS